ncbi:MAG: hypothetical protein E6I30_09045 [Chloroflexi bacterium]|nr:MAG: hypothetical protein E6I30_09045 [Chloroflexota bacterium]
MRDTPTRKADVLAALEKQGQVWLATAEVGGRPHVIAVSAWWDGTDLVVTTSGSATGFSNAMGWDPREMDGWMFFRLRPTRIQAFRGYEEIEGRDVMIRSRWLA